MRTNYHTHNYFCDGKCSPEEYVKTAISRGFSVLGFSSHAPIKEENDWTLTDENIDDYFKEVNRLKEIYADEITIYSGLEIDYYPDENRFETLSQYNPDYIIGSVHMVKPEGHDSYYSVDYSKDEFERVAAEVYGDVKSFIKDYFSAVRDMIRKGGFDVLGHIDLVRKFNRGNAFFNEDDNWYRDEVLSILDLLEDCDIIMEVNTGAISRGWTDSPYPSEWVLKEANRKNIKICLNSDAHHPDGLDCYFDEALKMIKECGYSELTTPFETIKI